MKHLKYYKQRDNAYGPKAVKVKRTYWADDPRVLNYPVDYRKLHPNLVKVREYIDEKGEKRLTVEIEV